MRRAMLRADRHIPAYHRISDSRARGRFLQLRDGHLILPGYHDPAGSVCTYTGLFLGGGASDQNRVRAGTPEVFPYDAGGKGLHRHGAGNHAGLT